MGLALVIGLGKSNGKWRMDRKTTNGKWGMELELGNGSGKNDKRIGTFSSKLPNLPSKLSNPQYPTLTLLTHTNLSTPFIVYLLRKLH
ncbi:hypothetical protein [Pedobacter sp. N23S346]|uniref:hypothetical protein n=1 Tax=Pedobacter sp. N23S346 TaxID=3402750 RepID=UPI003AD60195